MTLSFPLPLTDRFAFIMRALRAAVAARIRTPAVTAAMIVHIWRRLGRIAAAFEALAARIRTGKHAARPCGPRRAGGAGARAGASVAPGNLPPGLAPFRFAWLHRVAPCDAAAWAAALRTLLCEPEMAALLAATPRMGRILRPLCWMLGVESALLRLPPRAPRVRVSTVAAAARKPVAKPARVAPRRRRLGPDLAGADAAEAARFAAWVFRRP